MKSFHYNFALYFPEGLFLKLIIILHYRWCHRSTMSIQVSIWEIPYASLLYRPWGTYIHFWRAMVVWFNTIVSSHPLSACPKCCKDEICWWRWIARSSVKPPWLSKWSFLSFFRVTKWGSPFTSTFFEYSRLKIFFFLYSTTVLLD